LINTREKRKKTYLFCYYCTNIQ